LEGKIAVKQNRMLNNACTQTTEPQLEHSFANVSQAIGALTSKDYSWLRRLAARRLTRLRAHEGLARYLAGMQPDDLINETIDLLQRGARRVKPLLRIPMKADSCSDSCRTPVTIDIGQMSERSDARG